MSAPIALLVEDNATLRAMYEFVLKGAGFACIPCETGAATRATLGSGELPDDGPDLLVMDASLPDVPGPDLLEEIGARFPGVFPHTLIVTGLDPGPPLRALRDRAGVEVLLKPFRMQPFLEACLRLARRAP